MSEPSLGAEHERTIAAIVDTLVPEDEHGPGGIAAGAHQYIVGALADAYASLRPVYATGLAALDAWTVERHGAPFADLPAGPRADALRAVEAGEAPGFEPDAATFFAMVHHHMLEGMFGDPRHGGNRDFIGWRLIGFKGVKLVHDEADQRMGEIPDRPLTSVADVHPSA
jgi:gluconate 2-dehydrogenase gamma chain